MENTQIGDISNVMTKNYNNPDTDMEFNKIMCCYNNLSIDYPKTQDIVKLGRYEEKYNALKVEDGPYFFIYAKGKSKDSCKELSGSNADRVCKYIHKQTGNKKYAWKDSEKKFNPSVLFNNENRLKIDKEKYAKLEEIMFMLKRKERRIVLSIKEAAKELSRSKGLEERFNRYDVFYHMCEKLIMNIFDNREEAAEYLLDMEYLQRENENRSKNILWNCFGDLVYKNICNNLCYVNVKQRRKHYETGRNELMQIENRAVEILKCAVDNPIIIYKEEIEWLDNLIYKRGCSLDRELLYIMLVLQKRNSGKVRVYINQKKKLTCNTIDKWLGDGVCVCRKGLARLEKRKYISLTTVSRNYYEIEVNVPEYDILNQAFEVIQRNPLIDFYKNNGEKKIGKCVICGRDFIKTRNAVTCSDNCSRENRKRNNSKYSA